MRMMADNQICPHLQIRMITISCIRRGNCCKFLTAMGYNHTPAAFCLDLLNSVANDLHLAPAETASLVFSGRFTAALIAHGKKADTSGFIQYQWSGRFFHIHANTNGLCTKFLCFLKGQGQPVLSGIHNVIVAEIPDICVNISQNLFCIRMDCMHQTHLGCLCQCRRIVHQGAFHVSHHMICTGQKFCNLRSQKVFVLPFLLHIFIKTDIAGKGDCCILFQFHIPLPILFIYYQAKTVRQ